MPILVARLLLLLHPIVNSISAIQIGHIENAILIAPNSTSMTGSCDQCMCLMLNSNQSIRSFNCYESNRSCSLFFNYSQTFIYQMEEKLGTSFYFLEILSESLTALSWSFDGSVYESENRLFTTSSHNLSFISPGIYGRRSAIYFNGSQYLNMTSSGLKLSYNSFTFELWVYPLSLKNGSRQGSGILGQCQLGRASICLHTEIQSYKSYFSFYSGDCIGQRTLNIRTWTHLALTYDLVTKRQSAFVNGEIDCSRTANALQITNIVPLTLGVTFFASGIRRRYFHGYVDELSYVNRAKSADEIFNDATLIAYFSFNNASLLDSGTNHMIGIAYQLTFNTDALLFNQNSSAFQLEPFDSSAIANSSTSILFHINPSSTHNQTIVHIHFHNSTNNDFCWNMIRFDHQGRLLSQTYVNETMISITSSFIFPTNVWTHIAQTYSLVNGYTLYINGTLISRTGALVLASSNQAQTMTLGNCLQDCQTCDQNFRRQSPYVGLIDEFRIYSKELNSSAIRALIFR